jgi:hypothetical protein
MCGGVGRGCNPVPSSEPAREQPFARLPRLPLEFLFVWRQGALNQKRRRAAFDRSAIAEDTYSLDFANHPFILELKGENYGTS